MTKKQVIFFSEIRRKGLQFQATELPLRLNYSH